MKQEELLSKLKNDLNEMNCSLQLQLQGFAEIEINMNQKYESLQASLAEIREYITIVERKNKKDDNIFFVGTASQDKSKKLQDLEQQEKELEEKIEKINKEILQQEKNKKFFVEMKDYISNSLNLIQSYEKDNCDIEWIEKLKMCQKLLKVDYERCGIELDNVIKMMEKES